MASLLFCVVDNPRGTAGRRFFSARSPTRTVLIWFSSLCSLEGVFRCHGGELPFFLCRGRSQTGPQLRTSYHLFGQTRRSRGTAPAEIFANPGPSGPVGIQTRHSDFARRKFSIDTQVRVPRNGVRGKATMSTKCSSGAVPGDPLVSFPSLGKKLAAGAAKSLRIQQTQSKICPLIRPSVRTGAPSPWGEGLWRKGGKIPPA